MKMDENTWLPLEKSLKAFIISKVKDPYAAEDILQDTFLKVHHNLGTLKDDTKVKAWIFQVTRNVIMDYFRKHKGYLHEGHEAVDLTDEEEANPTMEEAITDMIHTLDKMAPEQCEVLCQVELKGLSIQEFALHEGISYTAAKTRVHRARESLRTMMMKCCHYEFDKYGTVFEINAHQCCCCHEGKQSKTV